MTTINTIDDLIKIIREQPEAREAVRREILTEELLALPQEIAAMARIGGVPPKPKRSTLGP